VSRRYVLIDAARRLLRLPYGVCIFDEPPRSILKLRDLYYSLNLEGVCTVGDIVTMNVVRYWRVPDIAIIDYATRRSERLSHHVESMFNVVLEVEHERSSIDLASEEILARCRRLVEKGERVLIKVRGEEDILAIPAILVLKKFLVVYGNVFLNCLVAVPSTPDYRRTVLKLYVQFRCDG